MMSWCVLGPPGCVWTIAFIKQKQTRYIPSEHSHTHVSKQQLIHLHTSAPTHTMKHAIKCHTLATHQRQHTPLHLGPPGPLIPSRRVPPQGKRTILLLRGALFVTPDARSESPTPLGPTKDGKSTAGKGNRQAGSQWSEEPHSCSGEGVDSGWLWCTQVNAG